MKSGFLCFVLLTSVVHAEPAVLESRESFFDRLDVALDIRPTYSVGAEAAVTENHYSVHYALTPNTVVGWLHFFNTNLFNGNGADGGLNLYFHGSYLRAKFNNLWVSPDGRWDFSVQPRLYLPTYGPKRADGFVGLLRTHFNLRRRLTPSFALTGTFMPLVHAYSQASNAAGDRANKAFELRYYLTATALLGEDFLLIVPLKLKQTRFRTAGAGVASSGAWEYRIETYPELHYTVDSYLSVGVGFETASFIAPDFSAFSPGNALDNGAARLILRAVL